MFNYLKILMCFFIFCSLGFVHAFKPEEQLQLLDYTIPHFVHSKANSVFCVEFMEFPIKPNSPEFGDLVWIRAIETEHFSEGCYRYKALLENARTHQQEYFVTRIVAPSNRVRIESIVKLDKRYEKDELGRRILLEIRGKVKLEGGEIFKLSFLGRPPNKIQAGDVLELTEKTLEPYKNYVPGDMYSFEINIYREGVLLEVLTRGGDITWGGDPRDSFYYMEPITGEGKFNFSKRPFHAPTNNRFLAQHSSWNSFEFGTLRLFGIYPRARGYEIVEPEGVKYGWWMLDALQGDLLYFTDEDGTRITVRYRAPYQPPFMGFPRV